MKKKYLILSIIIFIVLAVGITLWLIEGNSTTIIHPAEPPSEVIEAAQRDYDNTYKNFLEIDSDENIEETELGNPFQIYTISSEKIDAFKKTDSIYSIISPTSSWAFPVLLGDESKGLLEVDYFKEKWQAVSLGAASQAESLNNLLTKWPKKWENEHLYVYAPHLNISFYIVNHDNNILIIGNSSAKYFGYEDGDIIDIDDLIEYLKKIQK